MAEKKIEKYPVFKANVIYNDGANTKVVIDNKTVVARDVGTAQLLTAWDVLETLAKENKDFNRGEAAERLDIHVNYLV